MLQISNLNVNYGEVQILQNVSFDISQGEIVSVIGANGAGKSTLVKTISGLVRPRNGDIFFCDKQISSMEPHKIVENGLVHVPEGRWLFPNMTVKENLEMGAFLEKKKEIINQNINSVFSLFPILNDRQQQIAQTLSGGEQQMLAIGRALMSSPKLVIFDEPSLGLAPKLVQKVIENIQIINRNFGITILLIEQNVYHACLISNRGFVLENGEIVISGTGKELLKNKHVRRAYLGL